MMVVKAQQAFQPIGVGATPFALSSDYQCLGWNPSGLTHSPLQSDWERARGSMEFNFSLRSSIFERQDLWDDILNRESDATGWSNLSPTEWINRLTDESIDIEIQLLTFGTARRIGKWGFGYSARQSFNASSYWSASTVGILLEGGASDWFELVVMASGDTVPNDGDWSAEELLDIVAGIDQNGNAILSELLADSKMGFSWHRTHDVGVSRSWGSTDGLTLHTGLGARLLMGNGYFSLRETDDGFDAFGAFSDGFSIGKLDSLVGFEPSLNGLRQWGPVGQGWGLDLGVTVAFRDRGWASLAVTDIGWMEWRGERYSLDGISLFEWDETPLQPDAWLDLMTTALDPTTWFQGATSEIRRIRNGIGFHLGGGIRVFRLVTLAADATFDNPDLIGNAGTRLGCTASLQLLPWVRVNTGVRKLAKESIRIPIGLVIQTPKRGWQMGVRAADIQGLWKSSQPEVGAQMCFMRWIW